MYLMTKLKTTSNQTLYTDSIINTAKCSLLQY